ncbi:MAG: mitochondrial fission ELM1 family protein [Candidatus Omnitrophica bacterium]|nr:mitochondrial fission ELM1 family protein [Candidatus Omnitrophota bacterium]
MRDSIAYYAVKILGWIVVRLPESAAQLAAEAFARLYFFLDPRKRFPYQNLKAAFGPEKSGREIRRIACQSYMSLARTFVEVLRFPLLGEHFVRSRVVDQKPRRLEELLAPRKGKGAVYVTGHLGNWELSQFVSNLRGFPLKVIARPQPFVKLDELLNSYRSVAGTGTIQRGMGIRDAFRALKDGEILGFVQDQAGGADGTYVRFFGRLTSFPLGAFKMARDAGVPAFPAFVVRVNDHKHMIVIEDARVSSGENKQQAARKDLEHFVTILERYIREYPEQWLWMHRRWKHTKTKFIAVLLDEKAGHSTQSGAVLNLVKKTYRNQDPETEILENKILVRYKSLFHRWAAHVLTFLLLPWLQGRLGLITWTLERNSARAIETTYADIVISAGSANLPIHAAYAKENRAKKIVVMKPSFPYSLLRYEVAIIPEHDRPSAVRESFYIDLAPNLVDGTLLEEAGRKLREGQNLPDGHYIALLLGGDTKSYELDLLKLDFIFREINHAAERFGAKLLVTTSRRTPDRVEKLVREHFASSTLCRLLIIANERNIDGAVYGMMSLAEAIVVTEDSISMISESIQSGKPVLVLQAGRTHLRSKYERFQQILRLRNYAALVTATEMAHELSSILEHQRALHPCADRDRLTRQLAGVLL